MKIKEVLMILTIFFFFPTLVMAGESYDVYAEKGEINQIDDINVSKYTPTKNTFSGFSILLALNTRGEHPFTHLAT